MAASLVQVLQRISSSPPGGGTRIGSKVVVRLSNLRCTTVLAIGALQWVPQPGKSGLKNPVILNWSEEITQHKV